MQLCIDALRQLSFLIVSREKKTCTGCVHCESDYLLINIVFDSGDWAYVKNDGAVDVFHEKCEQKFSRGGFEPPT